MIAVGLQMTPRHEVIERSNSDMANAWSDPTLRLQPGGVPQVRVLGAAANDAML